MVYGQVVRARRDSNVFSRQRVGNLYKISVSRMLLNFAKIGLVGRSVAERAIYVTALQPYKNLTAADQQTFSLHGRKNLRNWAGHFILPPALYNAPF
jgi:hypothetical protein